MSTVRALLARATFSKAFAALVVLFLLAPLLTVIGSSFNADEYLLRWEGFTLRWYAEALADPDIQYSFTQSLYVSIWVMVGTTFVATCAALGFRAYERRGRTALGALVVLRMVLPEVVAVCAIFLLGVQLGIPRGYLTLIAAQVVLNSGFAILLIRARSETVSGLYEHAAADLGASPIRTYLRVLLPLLAPALAVSALLTFTFSFDAVTSAVLLGGPDVQTLTVHLLAMVRRGVTAEANAVSVLITLFNLLMLAVIVKVTGVRGLVGMTQR
jgi:ABC-type spermidine/putrescine transport system permease subunit II